MPLLDRDLIRSHPKILLGYSDTTTLLVAVHLLGHVTFPDEQKRELDAVAVEVAAEAGRPDLPIVSNVDIGHTDPQLVFPLGVEVEIDCDAATMIATESAVA